MNEKTGHFLEIYGERRYEKMDTIIKTERHMKTEKSGSEEIITPEIAAFYLEKYSNPKNRKISKTTVSNYADAMKAGKFMANGETIVFDWDGIIQQGHHRLHAIVKSGVPVTIWVIRGVDPACYSTYDSGKNRKAGDVLSMVGACDANRTAAMLSVFWWYEKASKILEDSKGQKTLSWHHTQRPTRDELVEIYEENRDLADECVRISTKVIGVIDSSNISFIPFFVGIHGSKDALKTCLKFVETVGTCEFVGKGDPEYALHKFGKHQKNESGRRRSAAKFAPYLIKNACIRAWNAKAEGRQLFAIKVTDHSGVLSARVTVNED